MPKNHAHLPGILLRLRVLPETTGICCLQKVLILLLPAIFRYYLYLRFRIVINATFNIHQQDFYAITVIHLVNKLFTFREIQFLVLHSSAPLEKRYA